jgi:4-hydroxybenzoate polyprenyltransferase
LLSEEIWMANRWWIYQRERFPLLTQGLPIAAFSISAVCFSRLLRGDATWPQWRTLVVAYGTSFLFLLQLRIADEFKDIAEDTRYRPYRPVPRGLVSLRELGWIGALAAGMQLMLGLWLQSSLVLLLAGVWVYLVLMSKEFFIGNWLRTHPIAYMLSHMVIVPLVDLYATACDWWPAEGRPPPGLFWFVVVSYFNGLVIEIGRKIRAPADEERGVDTYSVLWGPRRAVSAWLAAMAATATCAIVAAWAIEFQVPVAIALALLLLASALVGGRFLAAPDTQRGKAIETLSGMWTTGMYLSLGVVPLVWRLLRPAV